MAAHKSLTGADIHAPYAYTYADAAARAAATGFVAADVGKLARQSDTNSLWLLAATTPTWVIVGTALPFASLTSTPTTLAGYGISDAASDSELAAHEADTTSVHGIANTATLYAAGGTDVALADGGTGASLADPNADRILFWDDSAGTLTWLEAGTGLTITGTTIAASGSGLADQGTATFLDFSEAAAPSTPASGKVRIYTKADGNFYQKDDAGLETGLAGGGGGGGDSTTTAANASRPSASNDGNLFLPNNGFYIERDTGAAWAPWGPIYPMVAPPSSGWSWVNQGSAAVDTTNGGIYLNSPAQGNVTDFHLYVRSAPTPPYVIDTYIKGLLFAKNYLTLGLLWRQSSDGKFVTAHHQFNSNVNTVDAVFSVEKFSGPAAGAGAYVGQPIVEMFNWVRIADDNTSRIVSVSIDGQHWHQYHSVSRTDYLTANQVGIFAASGNNATPTQDVALHLLSWYEH